ncbi:alpha/beta hydrolase fold domain-containing protein [Chloroflexota bacterium]
MIFLAYILSGLSLLMSALFLVRAKAPQLLFLLFLPLVAGALSPIWAIMGLVGAVLGWVSGALWAVPMGIVGAITMILYIWGCTRDHKGFEKAFGDGWKDQIHPEQAKAMVKRRWSFYLKMKASPEPIWERDIPFWTIPDTDRQLLCDLWRPADGDVSGLAYIYLHGSSWAIGDKDMFTRQFFNHLTAQGHTVMDVAYRLIPEVDIYGMVGDAKRAVAWMKDNVSRYGVDPKKIVLGGGSAGAHIALLAGYTPDHLELTPEELKGADLSVCSMLTYYPPTDLVAGSKRYNDKRLPSVSLGASVDPKNPTLYAGRLDILLGGYPEDAPDMYRLACPSTHVNPGSPPTLSLRGDKDSLNPKEGNQELYAKLVESGVPAIDVVFPWTDHVFDLLLPQISPPAQSALYDVDRFLALMLNKD